jgi:gas vesicle protein
MNRSVQFLEGLVLGAALSAAVVLLFAPQSGDQTRQMIRERVQEVVDEGRQAAEERRLELTAQFERLKEPVTQP